MYWSYYFPFPFLVSNTNLPYPMSQTRKKPMWSSKNLPDDVVFDILTRVPVKSLIRFRCVSKSYNSTITGPIFITKHFDFNLNQAKSLSNNHNGYLLYESELRKRCSVVCIPFEIPFDGFSRAGFCNCMFLFHKWRSNVLYLWNPSIRKFKMLNTTCLCVLVARENVTLGLAYHSQNNDFKILRIENYKIQPLAAEVYTVSIYYIVNIYIILLIYIVGLVYIIGLL